MFPIPAATTTLSNMAVTSQPVFGAFIPYGYLEVGIIIAAALVLFLIYTFRDAIAHLLHHTQLSKFDNEAFKKKI